MQENVVQIQLSTEDLVLLKQLNSVKGISVVHEKNKEKNVRCGEIINMVSIIITSLAIPSLLKIIQIYIETKKIDLEIEIPNKNQKIKVSGLSPSGIKEKIDNLKMLLEE